MKTRWKYLREGMKSAKGDCVWVKSEWKKHDGKLNLCRSGFHCSKRINDAFSHVQGEILAKVEVKGNVDSRSDKECWSNMRVVRAWKWQKKDSVSLAVYATELYLKNFEKMYPDDKRPRLAIEAAKYWIDNPNSAAASAARAARAAYSAAYSAARAADSAAYSAAYSARKEICGKISAWMNARAKELEEIK